MPRKALACGALIVALALIAHTAEEIPQPPKLSRTTLEAGTANRLLYNQNPSGLVGDLAAITASRALQSDADGLPVASSVTTTELGFVSGVTSAIQTQIDGLGDHGGLSGLTDDDHTQYTLADGTRAFTGDQSMGSNRLTNLGIPLADGDAISRQFGFQANSVAFTVGDDAVVRIDNAAPGMVLVVYTPATSNDNQKFGILGTQGNNLSLTLAGGVSWEHLTPSDTPPSGTSASDGNLAFQMAVSSSSTWWVENRLGGSRTFRLIFVSSTYVTATITATAL